jgi:hypothetical protein
MLHVQHDFDFSETNGAAITIVLTAFSFLLEINIEQADTVAQFVLHVLQGAAASLACIVGFLTIKKHYKNG